MLLQGDGEGALVAAVSALAHPLLQPG